MTKKTSKHNNSLSAIRERFHRFLKEEKFIEEIQEDFIEITENNDNSTLKTVKITKLDSVKKVWKINLEEMVDNKDIPGISTTGKTPEIALLILVYNENDNYQLKLYVCLIELKSSLKPNRKQWSCLPHIAEKFQSGMNKMYLLLTLNNHDNPLREYINKNINVIFKGIIFYNDDNIDRTSKVIELESLGTKLLEILDHPENKLSDKLSISTVLESNDKIEIRFFKNPYPEEDAIETTIEELIKLK